MQESGIQMVTLKCYLGKLFPAATDIIVSNGVQGVLLFLSFDRLTFAVDHGIRSDDTERGWVSFNDLYKKRPLKIWDLITGKSGIQIRPIVKWSVK